MELESRILAELAQLKELLQGYKKSESTHSEHRNELWAALAKAQGEYPRIGANAFNPFHKSNYANLDTILVTLHPILAKHGLAFNYEKKITEDGIEILWGILSHSSGQFTSCQFRILPVKNDPQSYGSALTYAMRYAAKTLLGVSTSNDPEDDDGEAVMTHTRFKDDKGTAINDSYRPSKQSTETLTKDHIKELEYELDGYPDIAEKIMETYKINSIADLPETHYRTVITRLREVKTARNSTRTS